MIFKSLKSYFEEFRPTESDPIHIGRKVPNDTRKKLIDLSDDSTVGRFHAITWIEKNAYWIKDENSKNNTYINGNPIRGRGKIKFDENDVIFIGLYKFTLYETQDLKKEPAVQFKGVSMIVKKDFETIRNEFKENRKRFNFRGALKGLTFKRTILQPMNIDIYKGEFVSIIGSSGSGKSTLLKLQCRELLASTGIVKIFGQEITENWNFLKRKIGYLPQDNIFHEQLTVYEELRFSAKLRMGDNISEKDQDEKIHSVLENLGIENCKNRKIKNLSGGEKKRVCIAIELLIDPVILFLDEPTSPLDPETINDFLTCISDLNKKGTTIIMVTHKIEDIEWSGKVIMMAKGGFLSWFGNSKYSEITNYFKDVDSIKEIYKTLNQQPEYWYKKWIDLTKTISKERTHPRSIRKPNKHESDLRQFYWLTVRCLAEKSKDIKNIIWMSFITILIPIIVGCTNQIVNIQVLFWIVITALFIGIFNAGEEILSEQYVYKRERMFNLKILTYLFSKITVFMIFSLIQSFVFISILWFLMNSIYINHYVNEPFIKLVNFQWYFLFMALIITSSSLMGLFISAYSKTIKQAMTIMSLVLILQIVFSGVIVIIKKPVPEKISYFFLGRWGTEGLARIQNNCDSFKTYITTVVKTPILKPNPKYFDNKDSIFKIVTISNDSSNKSVYSEIPVIEEDTFMLEKNSKNNVDTLAYSSKTINKRINPLIELNYEKNIKLSNWFSSINRNLIAIMSLNLLVFCGLWFVMKKKDPT